MKSWSYIPNYLNKEEYRQFLPAFPKKKYIINGSTQKIEYRRLALDSFLQNLLLDNRFKDDIQVSLFFRINNKSSLKRSMTVIDTSKKKYKIMLLNKQTMEVEIGKNTEAIEVCTKLCKQLNINYVKDKRLFLFQKQRIVKIFDNKESIINVLDRFKFKNKIAKISITKIKNESSENMNLGKYLNLYEGDELHLVFL